MHVEPLVSDRPSSTPPQPHAGPERRRPGGRPVTPSPELIALLRSGCLVTPPLDADPELEDGDANLGPCFGLLLAVVVSGAMWVGAYQLASTLLQ